jgi:hypothetical protein
LTATGNNCRKGGERSIALAPAQSHRRQVELPFLEVTGGRQAVFLKRLLRRLENVLFLSSQVLKLSHAKIEKSLA